MSDTPEKSEQLKAQEEFLKDRPRLGLDDEFHFSCYPGISCFNRCCRDVNIILSPYDVLRLKNRLGITSAEFLQQHTLMPVTQGQLHPIVFLKMEDNDEKTCSFVSEKGCGVYGDRPWPCRMYPVGHASNRTSERPIGDAFYFLVKEDHCKGHEESHTWTIREWMENQGTEPYDRMGEFFRDLTLHPNFMEKRQKLTQPQTDMYMMALYDLDKFRKFLFESTFFTRFVVRDDLIPQLKKDDEELLEFGFLWLRYALFGEKTMKVRPEAVEAVQKASKAKEK
ncbi:MAG: YkgJ family cysteine cluster protein [Deltaproteobacteria bacterium]|nr:YkgJ family cysteine cluster protein [Deltaproteobacteria bacterium]